MLTEIDYYFLTYKLTLNFMESSHWVVQGPGKNTFDDTFTLHLNKDTAESIMSHCSGPGFAQCNDFTTG